MRAGMRRVRGVRRSRVLRRAERKIRHLRRHDDDVHQVKIASDVADEAGGRDEASLALGR
jgi:hypothetical protein